MRDKLSRTTKLFQNELRLANQISRINFVRLDISHFDIVQKFIGFQCFLFRKNFEYKLSDSLNIQGFAPLRAVVFLFRLSIRK